LLLAKTPNISFALSYSKCKADALTAVCRCAARDHEKMLYWFVPAHREFHLTKDAFFLPGTGSWCIHIVGTQTQSA